MARTAKLKIGCCGFAKAQARYFAQFTVVEVQKTFYQPPRPQTLARWREAAPAGFEFTLKAWQPITHPASSPTWRRLTERPAHPEEAGFFRPGETVAAAWRRTFEAAELLQANIVLFQCPASFTPEKEHVANLRRFFAACERGRLSFAWEPRGAWPDRLIAELYHDLDLIHCVDPLKRRAVTGAAAYFRLHSVTGYRYRYSDNDLARLLDLCAGFDEAYCLFNNMTMFEDATRFQVLAAKS